MTKLVLVALVSFMVGTATVVAAPETMRPATENSTIIGGSFQGLDPSIDNFLPMFSDEGDKTDEARTQQALPLNGVVSDLYVRVDPSPTGEYAFTVRKNGVDTAVTCTVAGATTGCSDQSNSVAFDSGDLITLKATPSGSP